MKRAAHPIHPDVAAKLAELDTILAGIYPSMDFAYHLAVEGQIVATSGGHEDVRPVVWKQNEIEAEVAKRADKPSVRKEVAVLDFVRGR